MSGYLTIPVLTRNQLRALWSKIDVRSEDECWPWLASFTGGSGTHRNGQIYLDGKMYIPHRIVYNLFYREEPRECMHNHGCVMGCCNPKHLSSGTHFRNMRMRDYPPRRYYDRE